MIGTNFNKGFEKTSKAKWVKEFNKIKDLKKLIHSLTPGYAGEYIDPLNKFRTRGA